MKFENPLKIDNRRLARRTHRMNSIAAATTGSITDGDHSDIIPIDCSPIRNTQKPSVR